MTVSLPQPNFSWMGQLANALGPQKQQMGSGYFPPAPSAPAGTTVPATGTSFLQRLISQAPTNQVAGNQYQPNIRLGG